MSINASNECLVTTRSIHEVDLHALDSDGIDDEHPLEARYKKTHISLRSVGRSITIAENCYSRTNHFITVSRRYIPYKKLYRFLVIPGFQMWFVLHCLLCVGAFIHWIIAFVGYALSLMWMAVLLQHVFVIRKTLPLLKKQPTVSDFEQINLNSIYELHTSQLQGMYQQAYNEGIGLPLPEKQSVEFNVLNESAITAIQMCILTSSLFLVIACLQFIWGLAWFIGNIVHCCDI